MKQHILTTFIFFCTTVVFGQYNYPSTKTVDSSNTLWSKIYKDPYRWLENLKEPEVEKWYKQQSNFTQSILDKISGRNELIAEYKKLDKLQPPEIYSKYYAGNRIFYKKTLAGQSVGKLFYRQGLKGKEILLFDPTTFIKGKTLSIQSILPSYDGKKILISYSEKGAEISTIKILDIDSKKMLPETIYPSYGERAISWTFDNKSFTYFDLNSDDNKSTDFKLNTKTKLHILGDDVKNDKDFFSNQTYPNLNIKPAEYPTAGLNKNAKKYIFANVDIGAELCNYYAPIEQFNNKNIQWKSLCKVTDGIVKYVAINDDIFGICNKKTSNFKLIHTTLLNPNWDNADVIAAEKPTEILKDIVICKNYLILTYSDGINDHLYKYNLQSKNILPIKLPYSGVTKTSCINNQTNNCYVTLNSWAKPYTEYQLNAETDIFSKSDLNEAPKYPKEYTDLQVDEVEAKGQDGTMIPLSIIYKKGLKLDGNNVCLMYGYGCYGNSQSPDFDILELALAVKGVVLATAHVRGGGEKGDNWYKGGFKTTKPNTWKDFNSCAEYLINKGFTTNKKFACMGFSGGGILVSRAITERPDLYAAAINLAGTNNMMRFEFTPNGQSNIPEFGTVTDSTECKALYEMDGLLHIEKGTKYPALLCVGGWNDPRVIVWQSGKFAAAMQNASTSNKPVLLKIDYDNGHFTEDKNVYFTNFANMYSFAMWQCGHPDFKQKD